MEDPKKCRVFGWEIEERQIEDYLKTKEGPYQDIFTFSDFINLQHDAGHWPDGSPIRDD